MEYPAARRTLLRLKKHLPRLLELLGTMPDSRRLSETWLETADVALGGKPDLVAISPDNLALVIDYKSGLVSDEEGVKSAYVRQLLFYGVLVDWLCCPCEREWCRLSLLPRGWPKSRPWHAQRALSSTSAYQERSQPSRPRKTASGAGSQLAATRSGRRSNRTGPLPLVTQSGGRSKPIPSMPRQA
jgi:hypothetical protein